jgi:hypothetical protein
MHTKGAPSLDFPSGTICKLSHIGRAFFQRSEEAAGHGCLCRGRAHGTIRTVAQPPEFVGQLLR